jgi:hypothetical protein
MTWPVAPDVDPVGERGERLDVDEEGLHAGLDVEAELLLQRQHVLGVVDGHVGVTRREAPHPEVGRDPARDDRHVGGDHAHNARHCPCPHDDPPARPWEQCDPPGRCR